MKNENLFDNKEELDAFVNEALRTTAIAGVSDDFGKSRGAYIRLLHPASAIVAEDKAKAGAFWHSDLCMEIPKPFFFVPLTLAEVRTWFDDGNVKCRSDHDVTTGRAIREGAVIPCPGRGCEYAKFADGRRRCSEGLSVRAWLRDLDDDDGAANGGKAVATIDMRGGSLAAGRQLVNTIRAAGLPPYALAFQLTAAREKPARGGGAPYWAMQLAEWPDGGLGRRLSAEVVAELAELARSVAE